MGYLVPLLEVQIEWISLQFLLAIEKLYFGLNTLGDFHNLNGGLI